MMKNTGEKVALESNVYSKVKHSGTKKELADSFFHQNLTDCTEVDPISIESQSCKGAHGASGKGRMHMASNNTRCAKGNIETWN